MSCRGAARFADADADPDQQQLPIILHDGTKCREAAPYSERRSNNPRPMSPLSPPPDWKAKQGIEQAESQPCKHAELPVLEVEIGFDRFSEDVDDRPVKVIQERAQ